MNFFDKVEKERAELAEGSTVYGWYSQKEAERQCRNLLRYSSETRRGALKTAWLLGILEGLGPALATLSETSASDFFAKV